MPLPDILFSRGFGTRRVCAGLVQQDFVAVAAVSCTEQAMNFVAEEMNFTVQRGDWKYHEKSCLILHRSPGCKCSQNPGSYPSISTLLPVPDRARISA